MDTSLHLISRPIMKKVKVDVLIIGAGASGLQCASTLLASEQSPSFMILEARDRVGGRIHTRRESATVESQKVDFLRDLGAAWVHGTGLEDEPDERQNPMIRLLKETTPNEMSVADYHLASIFEGNAWTRPNTILHKPGRIALFREGAQIANDSPLVRSAIQLHYHNQRKLANYATHLYEVGEGMKTTTMSLEEAGTIISESSSFSAEDTAAEDLVPFYTFLMENWNGLSSCDLQLSFALPSQTSIPIETDERYVGEDGDYAGPHCKLKHGMAKVIQPLYDRVADRIHLNERVVKVQRLDEQELLIETESGMLIESRCCISTIPVGCLQQGHVRLFQPDLGNDVREAIDAIAPGIYKKVFITFDDIFWSSMEPLLGLLRSKEQSDDLGQYLLMYNLWARSSIPCLEAVLCGNSGKWAVGRSDDEIRRAVLRFMEDSLGMSDLDARCISCHVTRWEEDPLTLGSYSSFRLQTLERHIDVFQEPLWGGDLIIAGEFTESDHQGSVQAALMSGERAGQQALHAIARSEVTIASAVLV